MATLNFTKNGNAWVSDEIPVSSDFNIHIERKNQHSLTSFKRQAVKNGQKF